MSCAYVIPHIPAFLHLQIGRGAGHDLRSIFFILPIRMYLVNVHRSIVGMLCDAARRCRQRPISP
jgi:hypothetical protein